MYPPQGDTWLLRDALLRASVPRGARVLDVCTGTGALALAAAELGAAHVCAVDVSRRAVLAARCNARLNKLPVTVRRGDWEQAAAGRPYDVVLANPPYVPAEGPVPRRGPARAWDAGADGRHLLDRLCDAAPRLLAPDGVLLLVQSSLAHPARTLLRLRDAGLKASVVARRAQPFGPVLRERAAWLEEQGAIRPGQREEELVVIRADRPALAG